jgi:hypothetical protein
MRVDSSESPRVRRLSPAAIALLISMVSDGAPIRWSNDGRYMRVFGGVSEIVPSRTVEVLARAGFISRLKDGAHSYGPTQRAKELF